MANDQAREAARGRVDRKHDHLREDVPLERAAPSSRAAPPAGAGRDELLRGGLQQGNSQLGPHTKRAGAPRGRHASYLSTPARRGACSSASASATWQATNRPAPTWRIGGVTVWHTSIASGQRNRNRHPSLGLTTLGGSPTSAASEMPSGARGSGTADRRSCVYGCFGRRMTSSVGPSSTRWPAYMTRTRSAM